MFGNILAAELWTFGIVSMVPLLVLKIFWVLLLF